MTIEGEIDHIAVIVCDTPIEGITEKFGDFGDNISDLLAESGCCGLPTIKYQIAFTEKEDYGSKLKEIYDKLRNRIALGCVKGVVLTGSRSDSFARGVLWIDLLDDFIKNVLFNLEKFPIVGICFGHQIIAKDLGCKVGRNLSGVGWECGTTTISLNKDIFTLKDSPFYKVLKNNENDTINDHLNLVEFHQDIVHQLPPPSTMATRKTSFQSIGSTAKCSIQGLITENGPLKILTFQGHPEFTSELALELLKKDLEKGCFDKNSFEKFTYNTQILNNQGLLIGKVIGNFINSFNT